jgi:carbon-monoxide dehydrogenase medium subunit
MTIRSFDLLKPQSLSEASELLMRYGDQARLIAGGTALVILMKQRAAHYPYLVDLQSIAGLDQIKEEQDGVRIGALVTHRAVERSRLIRRFCPVVAEAFSKIGNVRVRETASVGGNLAHADYRLDPPPPLLLYGAEITAWGPDGSRVIPLKDFFCGLYETALGPAEILVDIKIPRAPARSKAIYLRYTSLSANDWPCLSVAALLAKEDGRCQDLRLALGGVAMTPLLIQGLECASDRMLDESVVNEVLSIVDKQISPSSDFRGSEWYKRRMVRVFVRRAIDQLESSVET